MTNNDFNFSDDDQVVISSSDPVCTVGYINFTKIHLEPKQPSDFKNYVIKSSLDFISELNSSSYSDLSDPDLTDTELEFIEKGNFGKLCASKSLPESFTKNICSEEMKNCSIEDIPEVKFEYESETLQNKAHLVSNSKGWHWISSIHGNFIVFF